MNNLIVKEFNGKQIHTFIWKGKPCWIGQQILVSLDYASPSKTLIDCILAEEFENGIEHEVLKGEDLKQFKKEINLATTEKVVANKAIHLTILYEDGLYGLLQYTDKPIGVQFRKWLRREVVPEIRQTGAYITEKASPEMLREKADTIEGMSTLNETARILLPLLEEAGMKPAFRVLTLKQIYRKAGVDLPVDGLIAEKELYDLATIAKEVGIYSSTNKPHVQAVGAIISLLDISADEKELVNYENKGHMGTTYQYARSVVDKVSNWIKSNYYPQLIVANDRKYKANYRLEAVAC